MFLAWYMIMSVRNILNHSQLSVFQEAQIFLNSVKMQRSTHIINKSSTLLVPVYLQKEDLLSCIRTLKAIGIHLLLLCLYDIVYE